MRALATLCVLVAVLAAGGGAHATEFKTIYKFCAHPDPNCRDGTQPLGPVVVDEAGNVFGTASTDGHRREGVVFELVANADLTAWTYKIIHNFCDDFPSCPDGAHPAGGLIRDVGGALYGTTEYGGSSNYRGVAWRLQPDSGRTHWSYKVMHIFCADACDDGQYPTSKFTYEGAQTGALYDGHSTLYSVAGSVVFALEPRGQHWKLEPIHAFCCNEGSGPSLPLLVDGSFYGVTASGGQNDGGTFYRLSQGPHGKWQQTELYDFDNTLGGGASFPVGQLWRNEAGRFVGTSALGGAIGGGALFSLSMRDSGKVVEHDLYSFCQDADRCADGYRPGDGIVAGENGARYGVTEQGGDSQFAVQGAGTIFEFRQGKLRQLHAFCAEEGCPDGAYPTTLAADGHGNLFGATSGGGYGTYDGTVFEVTP